MDTAVYEIDQVALGRAPTPRLSRLHGARPRRFRAQASANRPVRPRGTCRRAEVVEFVHGG